MRWVSRPAASGLTFFRERGPQPLSQKDSHNPSFEMPQIPSFLRDGLQFDVTMDARRLLHSEVTDHPELQVSTYVGRSIDFVAGRSPRVI